MTYIGANATHVLFLSQAGPHDQVGRILRVSAWDYSYQGPAQWGIDIEVKEHSGPKAETISETHLTLAQAETLVQFIQDAIKEVRDRGAE